MPIHTRARALVAGPAHPSLRDMMPPAMPSQFGRSVYRAFMNSKVKARPNLKVITRATAKRVVVKGGNVEGVEFWTADTGSEMVLKADVLNDAVLPVFYLLNQPFCLWSFICRLLARHPHYIPSRPLLRCAGSIGSPHLLQASVFFLFLPERYFAGYMVRKGDSALCLSATHAPPI